MQNPTSANPRVGPVFDFIAVVGEDDESGDGGGEGCNDEGEYLFAVPPSLLPSGEFEADVAVFHQDPEGGWLQLEKTYIRGGIKASDRYSFGAPDESGKSIVTVPVDVATSFLCLYRDGYGTRRLRVTFPSKAVTPIPADEDDDVVPSLPLKEQDPADLLVLVEETVAPTVSAMLIRKPPPVAAAPVFIPKGPASWPGKLLVRQGQTPPDGRADHECIFADRQLASTPDHRLFQQGTDGWRSEEEVRAACEKPWRVNVFLDAQGIVLATCNG